MNEEPRKRGFFGRLFGRDDEDLRPEERTLGLPPPPQERESWLKRLHQGLAKTSNALSTGLTDLFTKRKLDAGTVEELEDLLIRADLGIETASRVDEALARGRYDREIAPDEVRAVLAEEVERTLAPGAELDDVPVMQRLLSRGRLIGRRIRGRWLDVGLPSGYEEANAILAR